MVAVISPHSDDAAFSLAGTLRLMCDRGLQIHILNCFTETAFAPFRRTSLSVSELRRTEDEEFARLLTNCRVTDLHLPDAPIRSGRGLRGIKVASTSAESLAADVGSLSLRLSAGIAPVAALVPLAVGMHADHYVTLRAAVMAYHSLPLAFYEDLPYACREGSVKDAVDTAATLISQQLCPVTVGWQGVAAWKQHCCLLYRSQIPDRTVQRMLAYLAKLGGERIWVTKEFNWRYESQFGLATSSLSAVQCDRPQ